MPREPRCRGATHRRAVLLHRHESVQRLDAGVHTGGKQTAHVRPMCCGKKQGSFKVGLRIIGGNGNGLMAHEAALRRYASDNASKMNTAKFD